MISVFVFNDTNDLAHWKWATGGASSLPTFINTDAGETYGPNNKFKAHVRRMPLPTVVLSPKDSDVEKFITDISLDTSDASVLDLRTEAMTQFIVALRGKIATFKQFKDCEACNNEPLCVFIHFGDGGYSRYNERLGGAWHRLTAEQQRTFLCFAITRNDTGFNQSWQEVGGVGGNNNLILPSTMDGMIKVLDEGCKCKGWEIELPEEFTTSGEAPAKTRSEDNTRQTEEAKDSSSSSQPPSSGTSADGRNGKPEVEQTRCRSSVFRNVLKWIIALELVGGFVLSWVKCFHARSVSGELGFGVLCLVFLSISVGVLLMLNGNSSSDR